MTSSPIEPVTPADWQWLAGQRVLCYHQFLGQNIMEGVEGVLAERSLWHSPDTWRGVSANSLRRALGAAARLLAT
jgi:hypothetical protein